MHAQNGNPSFSLPSISRIYLVGFFFSLRDASPSHTKIYSFFFFFFPVYLSGKQKGAGRKLPRKAFVNPWGILAMTSGSGTDGGHSLSLH